MDDLVNLLYEALSNPSYRGKKAPWSENLSYIMGLCFLFLINVLTLLNSWI